MAMNDRLRALRSRKGIKQAVLARQIGISASYLNLIENGKRPLTAAVLFKLARALEVDPSWFGEEQDLQLVNDIKEVFSDQQAVGATEADDRALARLASDHPQLAQAVVRLYRSYRENRDQALDLSMRLADRQSTESTAGARGPLAPWQLPAEEVSDFLQARQNYFEPLERAAERMLEEMEDERGARPGRLIGDPDLYRRLTEHLSLRFGAHVQVVDTERLGRAVRRFDPQLRVLTLSELLPDHDLNFQIAHILALLGHGELIDRLVLDPILTTDSSRSLARVALANYFAAALLMPYGPFLSAARTLRYDIDRLSHRFRTSFEQVCHRLTSLRRKGHEGVPFHFLRVDLAGNISKRFSASGIPVARYGGVCARWNLVAAFMQPGVIRTQLSQMPDGTRYFCIARTVSRGERRFDRPPAMHAICLGCGVEHADKLVYTDRLDLAKEDAAVPVGVTCRLCERMDCEQRAFPSMQTPMVIDENVRGRSFYASVSGRDRR